MLYGFDRVSVFRGMILVEGWSSVGVPHLVYGDDSVSLVQTNRTRDLADGRHAFSIYAIAGVLSVEHDAIGVVFPDGTVVRDPSAEGLASKDQPYRDMFARFYRETERGGRLLEIGSRARSGNVHHHLFAPGVDYLGIDIKDGPNVDVVGDAHELRSLVDGRFDFIFSTAVFEHLLMPWKVAIEMSHVMRIGGVALIASHAAFPLHEEPWDFWRYSRNAWKGLFSAHTGFEVLDAQYAGGCSIVADFSPGPPLQGIDLHPNYVLSACLVRKISEPLVDWRAAPAEVYDLAYDH